ncbi:MAG: L-glutamate gamma-semialdehyde dehydrogenase [Gemmatimonadota bacterium]|nr:L-glutamate gamma-semialdehyde dehydrogenase [Gemmatimonadota bacterium]MDH3421964.1 L-glutamate gamma-semialdehyde dehydrogenase [Gemmatimonadota bacterium]
MHSTPSIGLPTNEPVLSYAPGTPERAALKAELEAQSERVVDIPVVIGGKEFRPGDVVDVVMPHEHSHVIARAHSARPKEVAAAVQAALAARHEWSDMPWEDRAAVFMRAADLLAGPWRQKINAATMLGQGKSAYQAEIDAACELIDFFRFGAFLAGRVHAMQPISDRGMWNRADYRGLEGFVYAVSPFNFTAIAANLVGSPAIMGNTVVWKPSHTAALSSYLVLKLLEEAGLPPGVVNFVPGDARQITSGVITHRSLAGVHFTGSTAVFRVLWKAVGENIDGYDTYPRLVGETGGKDFIVAHPSADPDALRVAMIRGAFEYQGQKCSAASRAYIPASIWQDLEGPLVEETASLTQGDPRDFSNFVGAVIDKRSFDRIKTYIEAAQASSDAEVLVGGECDDSVGFFVRPTIIRAKKPAYASMCEEIFGPVLSVYVYDDADWPQILEVVDTTSPYALTGAIFARERTAIMEATEALRYAAGNFYVNDKPTGAVVGQQPFGGARASGTNDKGGSMLNLLRWVSARTVKETFVPPTDYRYPYLAED